MIGTCQAVRYFAYGHLIIFWSFSAQRWWKGSHLIASVHFQSLAQGIFCVVTKVIWLEDFDLVSVTQQEEPQTLGILDAALQNRTGRGVLDLLVVSQRVFREAVKEVGF